MWAQIADINGANFYSAFSDGMGFLGGTATTRSTSGRLVKNFGFEFFRGGFGGCCGWFRPWVWGRLMPCGRLRGGCGGWANVSVVGEEDFSGTLLFGAIVPAAEEGEMVAEES